MREPLMPIAIVGMSCRLPGGVSKPEDLWQVCAEQRDVWQPLPNNRMSNAAFYHPDSARNGTSNVRGGHFLTEDPGIFDARFFNLTETEARAMDPQQRILLELSYEALENAGMPISSVNKTSTGVFIGSSCRDYADLLRRDSEKTELYQPIGNAPTMLANRISYFFDLNGPSVTIDTACSSSLVALHLACNALKAGDARMAIVGGSNLILSHEPMIDMSMLRFLSSDGRCYTYDDRANGFGRGEGAACVVLKPFEDALRDGDVIRAVIRNSGTNQDGKTHGISVPNGDAQVELMKKTYEEVGLHPSHTDYIEAHGTGTPTGDPIEASSLSQYLAQGRPMKQPLLIGSIKSNIGHLEGASGIAAVVKVVLMLEKGFILPNFDFQKASSRIPMERWNIEVPKSLRPWQSDGIRRASLNNFGFGGSNAHAILDDATSFIAQRDNIEKTSNANTAEESTYRYMNGCADCRVPSESLVFLLSSSDEISGKKQAQNLVQYITDHQDHDANELMRDLAYTLSERRSKLPWRFASRAQSPSQLGETLSDKNIKFHNIHDSKHLGFIFTGQGAQWFAMGRELITRYPSFDRSLSLADECIASLGATWSLHNELGKDAQTSQVGDAHISQCLTTALQIALVDLLASWNIYPARVAGHSSGEIAAAYCAGALSQRDAMSVAYHRGIVALKLKDLRDGAMLAVGMSEKDIDPLVASLATGRAKVACINSGSSVTVSGDRDAIGELSKILEAKDVFHRRLAVQVAYHSHHMEDVADEYRALLRDVSLASSNKVDFYSSVTGDPVPSSKLGPEYWVSNMINPVQFQSAARKLLQAGGDRSNTVDILLEIGPHSALQGPIKQIINESGTTRASYIPTLVRNQNAIHTCQAMIAMLTQAGYPTNLQAVNSPELSTSGKMLSNLPIYAWDHSRSYWTKHVKLSEEGLTQSTRSDTLGVKVKGSIPSEPRWRNIVRPAEIPWINDHVVQSSILYPAAGFLAMAIQARYQHAQQTSESLTGYKLREISIGHALIVSQESDDLETLVSLRPYHESLRELSSIWHEFTVHSSTDNKSWTEHCRGLISIEQAIQGTDVDGGRKIAEEIKHFGRIRSAFSDNCITTIDDQEIYKSLERLGLSFGPTFKNLHDVRVAAHQCYAEVTIPDTASIMPAQFEYPFIIHPATLDSAFHALFPVDARHRNIEQGTPVPTFIEELFISNSVAKTPGHIFSVYAENGAMAGNFDRKIGKGNASVAVFDKVGHENKPAILVKGLVFKDLPYAVPEESSDSERRACYQLEWHTDPSLLSPMQTREISAHCRRPYTESDHAALSQQAGFYYAENALESLTDDETMKMQPHHRKLCQTLTNYCRTVREGQLGMFSTDGWLQLDAVGRANVCSSIGQTPFGILLGPVGESLTQIVRQQTDPLAVMIENDRLERYYRTWEPIKQSYEQAAVFIQLLGMKNPHLKILELGAGTGGATLPILEALSTPGEGFPHLASYDFTDLSPAFFEKAKKKLERWTEWLTFKRIDAEKDLVQQGCQPASYDLVIAANVIHATSHVERTMKSIRKILKPGGTILLIEVTVKTIGASLIFGTLPGWWNAEDNRLDGPLMNDDEWNEVLTRAGFTGANAILWDMPDPASHQSSTIISSTAVETSDIVEGVTIIVDEKNSEDYAIELQSLLMQEGIQCDIVGLLSYSPTDRICIVLYELSRSVLRNPDSTEYEAMRRVFLESNGVLWVTKGAAIESSNPDLSLVTGLARTVRVEKGDTTIVTLDLDAQNPLSGHDRTNTIFSVFNKSFRRKSPVASGLELEYAERHGRILIPRVIENEKAASPEGTKSEQPASEWQLYDDRSRPLRAEVKTPGFLDSIEFVPNNQLDGELADDHLEIKVEASGLNFRDVMTALGQIRAFPLGCECCGVVSAVGKSVSNIRLGARVVAMVKDGSFCNVIRTRAEEVELVPDDVPSEIAATIPIVYFTAYLAVHNIAHLRKDETILIHAAAGGLGQATINLCQLIGAKIFATVGTIEKQRLLVDKLGIPAENIFSSRDNTFAEGIMRMTHGKGVDVIINSLSGEALRLSWNCIAPFGRFIEVGKRDFTVNARLEMRNFEKNVSFTGLDSPFGSLQGKKKKIWGELMDLYSKGLIKAPFPINSFGVSELEKALRLMQSGKHMGKLVLVPQPGEQVRIAPSKMECKNPQGAKLFRTDASYLLVGGLGGIGRATARWMLDHGATRFIFASRSGPDRPKSRELIEFLRNEGAKVAAVRCDISDADDLERLLHTCAKTMPPIRGVIHGALVTKPDLFARLDHSDYNDVMRPKVDGVWNLHNMLSKIDLDFFVMLSSVVGIAGDPSQAAYVSASVFQDAFAGFRNGQGLPAVTLDLGKVVDIGIVAEQYLARRGVRGLWSRDLREEEVLAMIKSAIVMPHRVDQPASTIIGLKAWTETADPVFQTPLFSHFRRAGLTNLRTDKKAASNVNRRIRQTLKQSATLEEAAREIRVELIPKVSNLLMVPVERISPTKSLSEYGMDSLVAVEMRNWLLRELDAALPILELMADIPLQELSWKIAKSSKLVN